MADSSDKLPLESEEEEISRKEDAIDAMDDLEDEQPVESEKKGTSSEEDNTSGEEDADHAMVIDQPEEQPVESEKEETSGEEDTTSTLQSAASFKTEAMEIIKHGGITSSGMSSSEASKLLAAFLSLQQNERKAVLGLSHDDIAAEFLKIAKGNKEELKRREVKYATSPKRKRLCRRA